MLTDFPNFWAKTVSGVGRLPLASSPTALKLRLRFGFKALGAPRFLDLAMPGVTMPGVKGGCLAKTRLGGADKISDNDGFLSAASASLRRLGLT